MKRSAALAAASGLAILLIAGCKSEPAWKSRTYVERSLTSNIGEVMIPTSLWERVIDPEKPLKAPINLSQVPTPNQGGGDSAIAKASIETDLKPVSLYLIEESDGVLGGRNQKVVFGPGGGDIDLRDFVRSEKGAFRVVFEFAADAGPEAARRVWYLSNAQRRKVGPDFVGAGCDTYMDITSSVVSSVQKEGLLMAVSGDRHVSALAGTFLFAVKRGSRIEVARLTFTDSSKKKDILCRGRGES